LSYLAAQGAAQVRVDCKSDEPRHRGRSGKVQRVIGKTAWSPAGPATRGARSIIG
jgi:hypothetical protein